MVFGVLGPQSATASMVNRKLRVCQHKLTDYDSGGMTEGDVSTGRHWREGGRGGHHTGVQTAVTLERLKLRRGPRPNVSVVVVLLVQV